MLDSKNQDNVTVGIDAIAEGQQGNVAVQPEPEQIIRKRGPGATTITMSISREDKILLKMYALKNCTTSSDILHGWIQRFCKV